MGSRYLKLKEIRKALLMTGDEKEAAKIKNAMDELVAAGLVSDEEIRNASYL